jgi:hypothetical protein
MRAEHEKIVFKTLFILTLKIKEEKTKIKIDENRFE